MLCGVVPLQLLSFVSLVEEETIVVQKLVSTAVDYGGGYAFLSVKILRKSVKSLCHFDRQERVIGQFDLITSIFRIIFVQNHIQYVVLVLINHLMLHLDLFELL